VLHRSLQLNDEEAGAWWRHFLCRSSGNALNEWLAYAAVRYVHRQRRVYNSCLPITVDLTRGRTNRECTTSLRTTLNSGRIKPRSHRARRVASTRPHLAYLQVMYAYSSSCHITSVSYVIVNDVISTGVVWWWSSIATRTFWTFIVIRSLIAYV